MPSWRPDAALIERLYRRAKADRWSVGREAFAAALERSVARGVAEPSAADEVERYLDGLHLEDLALACACADGHAAAWDHFVLEFRPAL